MHLIKKLITILLYFALPTSISLELFVKNFLFLFKPNSWWTKKHLSHFFNLDFFFFIICRIILNFKWLYWRRDASMTSLTHFFFSLLYKNVDSMWLCVWSAINTCRLQMTSKCSKTSVTHLLSSSATFFYHTLKPSMINYWTDQHQNETYYNIT